ncbi:MAG: hypothetical protein JSW03_08660 [Candidatus Eiseniibacteriota bacterium]|nr:MAG: hypothetical protein JSW03_08660 [Candidatus Eisenbacteria bacterium]
MKRIALITGILALALLLANGLALAQEMEYEVITGEPEGEGTKRIEIRRIVSPGMGDMSCGTRMMHGMMGDAGCGSATIMCLPGGGGMACGPGGAMMCGPGMGGHHVCCGGGAMMCGPGGGMGGCCGGAMGCGPGCGPGQGKMMKGRMTCGPGGGMGGCCGPGGMTMAGVLGKLRSLGCICQFEKCAKVLELSEKQLVSLKEARMAAKKAAIQARANIQIAQMELDEILKGDSPDLTAVKAKISEIASMAEDIALTKISTLQKAQKLLTKEQLEKLKACKKGACITKGESCKKTYGKKVEVKKKVKMKEHMEKMEEHMEKMEEMKEKQMEMEKE